MLLTAEQVLNNAPNATVLTVDFFDTLVTRSLAQPTHVFAVMEQELIDSFGNEWSGFAVRRIGAEHMAREVASSDNPMRDVTIDEIYLAFAQAHSLSMAQRRELIEREKVCEIAHAQAVVFGSDLMRLARERGMQVIVVSDNYMPSSHIVNMAHAAGYSWVTSDDVVVSCEHGGMKHNGELWNALIEARGLDCATVLHVGDDDVADGRVPASYGIATHIRDTMRRSHRNMLNSSPAVLPLSRIEATLRDKYANDSWPAVEAMGAGPIALVVASQIADVMSVLKSRDVSSIHFVARDGYLAHQVWQKLRTSGVDLPAASYTSLSRSVIWRSGITSVNEDVVHRLVGDDEVLTVERLSRRVGCELQSAVGESAFLDAESARALLLVNGSRIAAAGTELRARLVDYVRSVDMLEPGHHLIVDLGWSGSTVAALADLVSAETDGKATLEGRLMGAYWDAVSSRSHVALNGYAVNEFSGINDNVRLLGCQSVFETLMSAPHGSVVGYSCDAQPEYVTTPIESHAYELVGKQVAQAAVQSAFEILTGTHPSGVTIQDLRGDVAWAAMMQLGHTPRLDEVQTLSSVAHVTSIDHEGDGSPLVAHAPDEENVHIGEVFDYLIHTSWVQGTLSAWYAENATRWMTDDIRNDQRAFQPQWVQIP